MRRGALSKWFLAAALVCGTALPTALYAQGPRGPGGPGGFGGGPGGGGGGQDAFSLLQNRGVQQELEIVPEQQEKVRDLQTQYREELRKEMEEVSKRVQAKFKPKLDEVLLPHQVERLEQIRFQSLGNQGLSDGALAEKLGITEEQKKQFTSIREELGTEMRAMFQNREEGVDMRTKFQEFRKKSEEKVLGVLTSEQKDKLEKLRGAPVDPELLRGGFGGPQRGGERGGDRPARNRPAPDANGT